MDLFDDLPPPKNETQNAESSKDEVNNKRDLEDKEDDEKSLKKSCSKENETEPLPVATPLVVIKSHVAERQGERDSMQDRHVILHDYSKFLKTVPPELKRISYFAVFDGHAGVRAADHCAEHMHKILADKISKAFSNDTQLDLVEKDMKRLLTEAFRQCDDEFLKLATKNKPVWKDGTTATVVLVINNMLYSANIGDSKAIIHGLKKNEDETTRAFTIELTVEHSASVYEERQRILKNSGYVDDGRVLGVLEVSRSIGDGALKAYGVTCVPDVRKCLLNSNFKYVIVGCDGLWKSFSNDEVTKFVNSIAENEKETTSSQKHNVYDICATRMANAAVKKLTADNISMTNLKNESDDDDSAPESISFDTSKQENAQQALKVKEQVSKIREDQKKKRIERQEKYIEQKKRKFDDLRLSEDVLDKLENHAKSSDKNSRAVGKTPRSTAKPTKKIFNDDEDEKSLKNNSISDLVPTKCFKNYGIAVVNLEQINKKPMIASDRAKAFKSIMFNRPGVRRQNAEESLAFSQKRKLVKSR